MEKKFLVSHVFQQTIGKENDIYIAPRQNISDTWKVSETIEIIYH